MSASGEYQGRMPVLFVGHGSPMNAIEDSPFVEGWRALAREVPRPAAIVCISAHWLTRGSFVTAMAAPPTIHDFYGFPQALFDTRYPCPGEPRLAGRIAQLVTGTQVQADAEWGLDHGAWSVLARMYPEADIPVLQLSMDATRPPDFHFRLGGELMPLRDEGVLIVASGNIVHNLAQMVRDPQAPPHPFALEFDNFVAEHLKRRDHQVLIDVAALGEAAAWSINSGEHYLPLLYAAALHAEGEPLAFSNDAVTMGAISMRCVRFG